MFLFALGLLAATKKSYSKERIRLFLLTNSNNYLVKEAPGCPLKNKQISVIKQFIYQEKNSNKAAYTSCI